MKAALFALTLPIAVFPVICLAQPDAIRERIQERAEIGPLPEAVRTELLSAIAFYPDEIIAAIFAVSQEPATLLGKRQSSDPEYNRAYTFLSAYPDVLRDLREHPIATRVTGTIWRTNPQGAWATIDQIRADYKNRSGLTIAEAVTMAEPPADEVFVPIPVSDTTASGLEVQGVVVQGESDSGSTGAIGAVAVKGESASAAGYRVVAEGENAAHAGAAGVVMTEEGQIKAGSAGTTVVQTEEGAVALGHAGSTNVDTQAGTFDSSRTAGAVNSQGEGVVAHQEASGSWDSDSYQRTGSGTVQTTEGEGAEWTHQGSGQVTETGASRESSTHVETKSGKSADVEHSTSVEKTDEGLDVEHGGSVTTGSGESYEWGNRDEGSQEKMNAAATARDSAEQGWSHFGASPAGEGSTTSRYARQGSAIGSPQAFSGLSLGAANQKSALEKGHLQQKRSFQLVEPKIAQGQRQTARGSRVTENRSKTQKPSGKMVQKRKIGAPSSAANRNARQHSSPGHGRRGGR